MEDPYLERMLEDLGHAENQLLHAITSPSVTLEERREHEKNTERLHKLIQDYLAKAEPNHQKGGSE